MKIAPKVFVILFVSLSTAYLLSSLFVITQKPQEYVRQDYFLPLRNNVGTIKVNCFIFPGFFLSEYFVYRIVETGDKVLLKKDLLACNFDYSQMNRTADVVNATISFFNSDLNNLTEKELHLSSDGEQIIFPMAESGNYYFEVWTLQNSSGWLENYFPIPAFYVYDSPEAYFAVVRAYRISIITDILSALGIFAGIALGFFLSGWGSSGGEIKRHDRPSLSSLTILGAVLVFTLLESYRQRRRKEPANP
jgi:hypothetical protein